MQLFKTASDRLLNRFVPKAEASASGWFTQSCGCTTTTTGRFYHYRECYYPGTSPAEGYHCDRCYASTIRC
ncbi:hypothetical protein [Microtetraspora niveoalba]|uniref:hypothetical protein n=1 Tax=Microtetraspora niveoalba TaxID=46175 RepID=UPI0008310BEC|nr:hypothetical protein [Microtetraspora niveoalba]